METKNHKKDDRVKPVEDKEIIEQIVKKLHQNQIEYDIDLYTGEREPWQFVRIRNVVPERNVHLFVLRRFFKICLLGVKLYGPIHLLPILLFKRDKIRKETMSVLWHLLKAQTKSSLFMASFTGSFLYVLCLFNEMGIGDHPFNAIVAGWICGLSCLFEPSSRRKELSIYCWARVVEICYEFGMVRNWWNKSTTDYFSVVVFSFSMGALMYYYHREPKNIKIFVRTVMNWMLGY